MLQQAREAVIDNARDVLGQVGAALAALPTSFPNLPIDFPASDCPYVRMLQEELARRMAQANNALGNAVGALNDIAGPLLDQANNALDQADALADQALDAMDTAMTALDEAQAMATNAAQDGLAGHVRYWRPADTVKERTALEAAYQGGTRPWMLWEQNPDNVAEDPAVDEPTGPVERAPDLSPEEVGFRDEGGTGRKKPSRRPGKRR